MIIASWNVNSIRARVEQVTAWLKAHSPDVLLLQELKGTEILAEQTPMLQGHRLLALD
jgi:exodeoxyribonuclease-3